MASSLSLLTIVLALAGSAWAQSETECVTADGDRCGFFDPSQSCQCNGLCTTFNNCCDDVDECPIPSPPPPISDTCVTDDGDRCNTFVPGAPCQCNLNCLTFNDCCDDVSECFDIPPPSPPAAPPPPSPPSPPPSDAPLIISEIADPNNEAGARYVEIFNIGCMPVVLDDVWGLRRFTNGNDDPQSPVPLTGTIPPRTTFIVSPDAEDFLATYGFSPDLDIGPFGPADSNGDDNIQIVLLDGEVVIDTFGVPGTDGTGTDHEFEDGRAERLSVFAPEPIWLVEQWDVSSDAPDNLNGPQNAPEDFDPGFWGGAEFLPVCPIAMTLSDPHMSGFLGQSFDFTGEPQKIYSLISDQLLAVNAELSVAYTTGVDTDVDTLEMRPMHSAGTWMSAIGLVFGESADQLNTLLVSVKPSPQGELECPDNLENSICFFGGSIEANGEPVFRLGDHSIVESSSGFSAKVNLQNSRSYGRVVFTSPVLSARIDYVPPSAVWGPFSDDEAATYAHLNFAVERVSLTDKAHGVLGQTKTLTYDSNGNPVMKSSDANGEGIIVGSAEDYVVASIFDTDFKYSSF